MWDFYIGGYQVCEKWLKDRKGRTLSKDDLAHYQKIVVAFAETIRIMGEIDEVVDAHGGWPGAFAKLGEVVIVTGEDSETSPRPEIRSYEYRAEPQPLRRVAESEAVPYATDVEDEDGEARPPRDELDGEDLICRVRHVFGEGGERERESVIDHLARGLGYQRTGNRIHDELDNSLRTAVRRGILTNEDGTLRLFARTLEQYDRAFLKSSSLPRFRGDNGRSGMTRSGTLLAGWASDGPERR